jgi:flagellar biosynthesis protein FlhG
VNLAFALAQGGAQVLVVDGDLGLANIDVLLGLTVSKTIGHILNAGGDPQTALVHVGPRLALLPAASGVPEMAELGANDREVLEEMLRGLAAGFDYVLIDTAAGLGAPVLWFNLLARHNLVLITPDPTSLTDAYALIKVLAQQHGRREFVMVVNQVADEAEARQVFMHLAGVAAKFLEVKLRYGGAVPRAAEAALAVRRQEPFVKSTPEGKASEAVMELAQGLRRGFGRL